MVEAAAGDGEGGEIAVMVKILEILEAHCRVAIVGGPGVGKTTLAGKVKDREVFHTDETMAGTWESQPFTWLERTRGVEQFVIEGVQTARYLRKAAELGLGCPVDAVIYLEMPVKPLNGRQMGMLKAVAKVFRDWRRLSPGTPVFE